MLDRALRQGRSVLLGNPGSWSHHDLQSLEHVAEESGVDLINHYWEEETRDRNNPRGRSQAFAGDNFAWAIRACLEGDTCADEVRWAIQDKKFLEAIEFLQETAKNANYEFDLHRENMMIRRTSVGVQLVLNDPLGFSTDAKQKQERGEDEEIEGHPDWE